METRKENMKFEYKPRLHDYVKWHQKNETLEGWVYYCGDDYISIEIGVKDKPNCEYTKNEKHKKIHVLVVCQNWYWHQLEYITYRENFYDESLRNRSQHNIKNVLI